MMFGISCVMWCVIQLSIATAAFKCDEDGVCPLYKQFCTPAGCVEKCPENSFENGTVCVTDCGNGVVDGSKCRKKCPPEKPYTDERVVVSLGTFKTVRFCLTSCESSSHKFVSYNNSCVSVCPVETPFVLNGKCSAKCPDSHALRYIQTDSRGHVNITVCSTHCPFTQPYSRNNTCVSECLQGELLLNDTCVGKCPDDSFIVYQNQCHTQCPGFKKESICVESCLRDGDSDLSFIFNGSCVDKCPEGYSFFWSDRRGNLCAKDCGAWYNTGPECFKECNDYKINNSCFQDCPSSAPFKYESIRNYFWNSPEKRCVKVCPENTYYNNNTCVSRCPEKYGLNRTCLQNCPKAQPFLLDSKNCIEQCPVYLFTSNFSCVQRCSKFSVNRTCFDQCPEGYFGSDGVCVQECPPNSFGEGNICVKCTKFSLNRTCVDHCPVGFFESAGICVKDCPTNTFYKGNKCDFRCSKFSLNRTCVDHCPVEMFENAGACVQSCPQNMFYSGHLCTSQCHPLYRLNDKCLNQCPPEQPYVDYDNLYTKENGYCVKKCGSDKLANGTFCMDKYDCKKPIKFNGQCLDYCPEGTYWVGNSLSDRFEENCQPPWPFTIAIVVPLSLLALLLVFYAWCFRCRTKDWLPIFIRGTEMNKARVSRNSIEEVQLLNEDDDIVVEEIINNDTHSFVV